MRIAAAVDLLILFFAAAAMTIWTWGTWPDPLVDWGARLYLSWRVCAGEVLYRDLAYFNGPLSIYFDAGLFKIFGVSQHVLWLANLAIFAGIIVMLDAILRAIGGRVSALLGGLLFVTVFAFGRYQLLGNFNYVTPYTPEMTHGLPLDLAAILLLRRYQRRPSSACAASMGVELGLCFLTKAEIFAPGFAAVVTGLFLTMRESKIAGKNALRHAAVFAIALLAPPLLALGLFAIAIPFRVALGGVLGSWPWIFDPHIARMSFYRDVLGTDDPVGHLLRLVRWLAGYTAVFGVVGAIARPRSRPRSNAAIAVTRRSIPLGFSLGAGAAAAATFYGVACAGAFRLEDLLSPLPLWMLILFAAAIVQYRRMKDDRGVLIFRITMLIFAGALLMKIALAARVRDYGFVLAMPAALMFADAIAVQIPRAISRRGGDGRLFAIIAIALCISVAVAHVQFSAINMPADTIELGSGGDTCRVAALRGEDVRNAVRDAEQIVAPNQTLLVAPQGLMINYLARRRALSFHQSHGAGDRRCRR